MTNDIATPLQASDAALQAVIANTTMHILVISQRGTPVIQSHTRPVISLADAQPFPLIGEPWQGHCLLPGRPGSGNATSDNGNPPSANHTGAAQ